PPQAILEEMIQRCHAVRDGLAGAERIMPVQTAANFSYVNSPVVGDRFLAVGDAITFLDPIFSAGVFVSLHTAELAAQAILQAFATGRFEAARFAAYERRVWRGLRPLFRFITRYYEPAFLDLFLGPKNVCGTVTSVLNVLSGGSFIRMPWRVRFGLGLLFTLTRLRVLARRATGLPVESRLEW
ncbi:MAG TPA: tryptophan 7-halogenase, partial [Candidatus Tectomicrobia bacterium]|nr:tryptophan 7-halogenase [Candidatus Tectomicrobia bacterium]